MVNDLTRTDLPKKRAHSVQINTYCRDINKCNGQAG